MIRSKLIPGEGPGEALFRWRGGDVSRLEGLTDAVIALALTLVMLSSEIPHDSGELLRLMGQFPAFLATFSILTMIWWYHFRFHRRFGLEDFTTSVLNLALLFVLLLFVYPLRYLFSVLFHLPGYSLMAPDVAGMMMLYGGGYAVVFAFFFLMYLHAWRLRKALELNEVERLVTRGALSAHLLHMLVGLISFSCACALFFGGPAWLGPISGLIFFLIGPLQGINGYLWGSRAARAAQRSKD